MDKLPIYVTYDSGIRPLEAQAIVDAMGMFKLKFPEREIFVFGSTPWGDGDYSSADWYIEKARRVIRPNHSMQLDAYSIIELLAREPWQKSNKHIDIFYTSKDLTAWNEVEWLNFCFGLNCGRFMVQSVARLRSLGSEKLASAIELIVWHELGHALGAAGNLNRKHTIEFLGPHCTCRGCAMKQMANLRELSDIVEDVMANTDEGGFPKIYCNLCTEDIKRSAI